MSRLRPAHPGDWLLIAGDVAEESRVVLDVLAELRQRFARVIWVPGNHELWTHPLDRDDRRGRMSPSPVQPTVTMSSSSTTTRRCGTVWVRRFDSSSGSSDADATRVVSLSLPIGSRRRTGNITLKDWNALAVDCDLEPDHVVNIVSDVNQRLSSQLEPAFGEFATRYSNLGKAVRQMQLYTTRNTDEACLDTVRSETPLTGRHDHRFEDGSDADPEV